MTLHGTVLGKYQILARLGEGGMGTVYHARDEMLDRDVAIKVLRPDLARQASLVERFRSEAIALARLAHPNIAALHGMERDGGQLLMIMEYVQGETLESRLHRTGGLPWRRAVEMCADVCSALDHAHDQGVVHRDIKPANVMVTPRGTIKVMDFGIARVIGRNRQTQSGRSVGTPMYMAPEQLRGEEVDGRTDIYALGAVLFELITGQLAFDADSDYTLMLKQLNEAPPAPSLRVSGVPHAVDAIVARAMAKLPSDRFASASAMRSELLRTLAATPPEAASPSAMPETRLALNAGTALDPRPSALDPGVTRLAPGVTADVRPTRLAKDAPAKPSWQWHTDWRTWSASAAVLLIATLVIRFNRSTSIVAPEQSAPSAEAPAAPQASQQGFVAQPVTQGAATTSLSAPPTGAQPSDPRLIGARPLVDGDKETPRATPKETEKARVAQTPPPSTNTRHADSASRWEPRPPTPVQREPETPPRATPEPEAKPAESATAMQAAARAAVSKWLAAVGASDAAASAVMDESAKPHAELIELLRSRRVTGVSDEPPVVDISGASATASVTSTVTYRSAFGATRRSPVQFAFELARDGSAWRVAKARIIGSPRLN